LGEESDVVLAADAVPTGFDYVALGHIHEPQCLGGLAHVRYSGSLDRMDFGERDQGKEVVLVDIGPDGRRSVVPIPIEPSRLIEVTIADPEQVAEQLAAQVPDPETAMVKVTVEPAAAAAGGAIDLAVRAALPHVTFDCPSPEPAAASAPIGDSEESVRERVLAGLTRRLVANDPDRNDLLALATGYLDREGYR
jgi:exonuclease SbcD